MEVNIKNDLSTLTTIDESVFTKLTNKVEWCISDGIEKAIKNNEKQVDIDIDIGTLIIKFDDDSIKYKFKPNARLEKIVANTVINEKSNLTLNIEESLVSKLINVYKNFF